MGIPGREVTKAPVGLSEVVVDLLRCPICRGRLQQVVDHFDCSDPACGTEFPILDGVPVLLNEAASLFCIPALVRQSKINRLLLKYRRTGKGALQPGGVLRALQAASERGRNVLGRRNCERFAHLLLSRADAPRVLVLGGRVLGQGIEYLLSHRDIELVETDVAFGPRTMLICDAHDIPFDNASFDGVIVQGSWSMCLTQVDALKRSTAC